ncbi:hypothetical protein BGZ68_009716 [Mortierella alpina]|nr:hypothetical protein BGZ68_009716 [Mortierella alpina]
MTKKMQQDTQSNKATPVLKGVRTGIFRSTPANEDPIEAKELPSDESVVKHELGEPSTQKTFGLPSPPYEASSDPSSDDDQQSNELKEVTFRESGNLHDCSVVQVGQDPVQAKKSSNYPTAPSSPAACEVLAEGLAGLNLDGNGEQERGPGPDECIQPKDSGSELASPTTAVPNIVSSSEPDSDGSALLQDDTKGKLEEESSDPAKSVVIIGTSHESIVSALEVTSEDSRNAESEKSESEDEQSGDQEVQASESENDDEAFTADFHPLIKRNLYHLIRDFVSVLSAHPDETILNGSPSVIAKKYRQAGEDPIKLRKLRTACEKYGQVYMLVCSPRPMDLDRMWFAGDRVRNPQETLPVKIGQSADVTRRFGEHHARCGMQLSPSFILPAVNHVELLERILHELFVAHQHDLLCKCKGETATSGKNHVEVFWFERLSGGCNLHEDFDGIVDALRSDMEKCRAFVESLRDRLPPVHDDTPTS